VLTPWGIRDCPDGDGQYTCYNCGWFDSSPDYDDTEKIEEDKKEGN